jgi:predicted MFS family arabinose efflux permease
MSRLHHPAVVLFACLFASQAALLVLSPTLVEIANEFDVSTATAGQLRSLSGAAGGVTALLLATASERPGLRELLSLGAALVAAGSVMSAVAPAFFVLGIAQAILGVGIGLLVALGIAATFEWPERSERAHVLAWAIVGMPTAWIAGMPAVGAIADHGWRGPWLAVPAVAGLVALALVRMRPKDAPSRRVPGAAAAWRRPEVARFAIGELLANAAWAGVLTYSGALLLESYDITPGAAALCLGAMAVAMLPGTFLARRRAMSATPRLLAGLTAFQAAAVLAVGTVRPSLAVTVALLSAMAFVNGSRSMIASALGMDAAADDRIAVMSLRAAANQFGYLLGAATGGLALAVNGFAALGITFCALFLCTVAIHTLRIAVPVIRPEARPSDA